MDMYPYMNDVHAQPLTWCAVLCHVCKRRTYKYVPMCVHEYVCKYYPFYEMDWKAVPGCNATRNCPGSMRLPATVATTSPSWIWYNAKEPGQTKIGVIIGRNSDIKLEHGPLAGVGHARLDVRSQGYEAEKDKRGYKSKN